MLATLLRVLITYSQTPNPLNLCCSIKMGGRAGEREDEFGLVKRSRDNNLVK